ncbi:hypothetical protein BTM25_32780 [Actinomadura rubteroloni]|uniref:SWIM-type domain-containing protein n=1 Tax=Actinomadura rubteroloni TaxID=1926885 RepID=A0A2P4UHV3_9ACTN|nr:hypothetical protein [Actinomadura rubteroloni]POM24644.1 hypothetical protein BTM25_32780 [Actinomadura rubteroloni]
MAPDRWWSRRFLSLVDADGDGEVRNLRVAPCEVTARVDGHDVALGIDAVDPAGWAAVDAALAGHPVVRARLLEGDVPPEIELVFAEAGRPLFPMHAEALHVMCGCDDWGDGSCAHAGAALRALADAFDADPFLILEWNGRARDDLLTALRRLPAAPERDEPGEPLDAGTFWTAPLGLAALRDAPPAPPAPPGLVLRVAAPPPVKVRRRDLADVLAPAYDALAGDD